MPNATNILPSFESGRQRLAVGRRRKSEWRMADGQWLAVILLGFALIV